MVILETQSFSVFPGIDTSYCREYHLCCAFHTFFLCSVRMDQWAPTQQRMKCHSWHIHLHLTHRKRNKSYTMIQEIARVRITQPNN